MSSISSNDGGWPSLARSLARSLSLSLSCALSTNLPILLFHTMCFKPAAAPTRSSVLATFMTVVVFFVRFFSVDFNLFPPMSFLSDWSTQMLKLESTAKTIPTLTKKIEQYKNQVRGKVAACIPRIYYNTTVNNVDGTIIKIRGCL